MKRRPTTAVSAVTGESAAGVKEPGPFAVNDFASGVHAPRSVFEHQALWGFSLGKLRLGNEANLLRRKVDFTSVGLVELREAEARQNGFGRCDESAARVERMSRSRFRTSVLGLTSLWFGSGTRH